LTDEGLALVLKPPRELTTGKVDFPPDVAFEIRSPGDRPSQEGGKRKDYQESGVTQVWIDLEKRLTEVVYSDRPPQCFSEDQAPLIDQARGLSLDLRSLYLT
jgi:Uma2 family endonuclease